MNVWPSRASVIQRSEDCVAVIPGCIQDVWARAITWLSFGPALCRPHVDGHCCAAVWCQWWVCPDVFSLSWSAAHDAFNSNGLHWLHCHVIWHPEASCSRFITRCAIFKLCCNVVCILATYPFHCTLLSKCLRMCVDRHAAVPSTLLQQCCEWVSFVHASNIMLGTLKCCCCNQHSRQECSQG